jgi:hypothetical protein
MSPRGAGDLAAARTERAPPSPGHDAHGEGACAGAAIRELAADELARDPRVDAYLRALALDGPAAFADNARATLRLVDASGTLLPIVIVEPRRGLSDVCSPIARYAGYPSAELAKRGAPWLRPWARAALFGYAGLLRACAAERAVYVNNWLLATNPGRPLSADQYARLNAYLRERYPRHAIVHRTVNPYLNRAHHDALVAAGARMVCTRIVYLVDPRDARFRRSSDVRRDRRDYFRSAYRGRDVTAADPVDPARLAELYRLLYLDKHCRLNAAFNARFFDRVLHTPFFQTRIFARDGRIDAFGVTYVSDGFVTGALTGYDVSLPRSLGLYRLAMMDKMLLAEARGMLLNLSGGAGGFKCLRGAFPVREFDAVFDAHLPPWRALPWRLVAAEGRRWRAPAAVVGAPAARSA